MQTPKSRTGSSAAGLRISPHSISSEVSGKSSPHSEASKKPSPRAVRQLKTSPRFLEPTISSSNLATRAPKEASLRLSDHNSPASPLSEKKRLNKVAELESHISQLENDLQNVKDQLCSSEKSKKQAQKDADESNHELSLLSSKLEESEKKLLELSASRNSLAAELSETSQEQQERDTSLQAELEALRKQQLLESAALVSALDEIERLKSQLKMVSNHSESTRTELNETLVAVEEMKQQLNDCRRSESEAQELVSETLTQLEAAKKMVEKLRSDGSHARIELLKAEVEERKAEAEKLRSELGAAEARRSEDQSRSKDQVRQCREIVEQIKAASGQREAELEAELRKSSYEIEELRSKLMDKETEMQGVFDENDALVERAVSGGREVEALRGELERITEENRGLMAAKEEAERGGRRAERAVEQLEAANAEMETELRKLKVQADQWRKAAEVAASMMAVERTGSMDNNYSSPMMRRIASPYGDDLDDELMKKKNVNVLRRFGVLWKKPHK